MLLSLPKDNLLKYLCNQLNTFFPDGEQADAADMTKAFEKALRRLEYCFAHINTKYFSIGNEPCFNHLNGDHYAILLYYMSNTLYREKQPIQLASKIFLLNKYLHGLDAFYEVELPEIFMVAHPLGTVLGRGQYSNYFMVYQRCNIGNNGDIYPKLGKHLTMHPGSAVLGNCKVDDYCRIAAGALLLDKDLEEGSLYIGNPRDYIIKQGNKPSSLWIEALV